MSCPWAKGRHVRPLSFNAKITFGKLSGERTFSAAEICAFLYSKLAFEKQMLVEQRTEWLLSNYRPIANSEKVRDRDLIVADPSAPVIPPSSRKIWRHNQSELSFIIGWLQVRVLQGPPTSPKMQTIYDLMTNSRLFSAVTTHVSWM